MRRIGFALVAIVALVAVAGCKEKVPANPVDQILELGIQAEKDIAENAAKQSASKDMSEIVELGKVQTALVDSATARIQRILGGKNKRIPVALGPCTDSLPVVFAHGSIGIPDFHKGEFRINLQISGTGKRPLPTGTEFQLVGLDATGKVLSSKDASMVDSLKVDDTLRAGGMFRGSEIKGLASVAAK